MNHHLPNAHPDGRGGSAPGSTALSPARHGAGPVLGKRPRGSARSAHWPAALAVACLASLAAAPLTAASAVAGDAPGVPAATGQPVTDADITKAVENCFYFQDAISPVDIEVSTDHGIVALAGSVDNLLAEERVVTVAESIRGVRGVVSLVTVQTSMQAQAERERQARVILGDAERQIAEKFAEAGKSYEGNPIAFHLRAMNMLYEGLKENATIVIVPSTAVESMQLGGLSGMTALSMGLGQPHANGKKEGAPKPVAQESGSVEAFADRA